MAESNNIPYIDDIFSPSDKKQTGEKGILDYCSNIIIQLDSRNEIFAVSKKLCSVIELREEDLVGFHIEKIMNRNMVLKMEEAANHARKYGGENIEPVELELIHRQGIPVRVLFRVIPLVNSTNDTSIGTLIISEERREELMMDEELIHLQGMATIGSMAGEIGHELNNFLHITLGHTQLLPLHLERNDKKKVKNDVKMIMDQVSRMKRMVLGLLDVTRDAKTTESADINDVILKTIQFLKPQNKYDNIKIIPDLCPGLPEIEMNTGKIQQVLINIFENSTDAMGKRKGEGGMIKVETMPGTSEDSVKIRIADTGPGIPERVMDKLFEPRFTTRMDGNGLGLFISRKIINEHNGTIILENSGNKGWGTVCTIEMSGY